LFDRQSFQIHIDRQRREFFSGYGDDAMARHGVRDTDYAFLNKPFTPTSLARKVREVLDEKK
jgi:hypothetical protein